MYRFLHGEASVIDPCENDKKIVEQVHIRELWECEWLASLATKPTSRETLKKPPGLIFKSVPL